MRAFASSFRATSKIPTVSESETKELNVYVSRRAQELELAYDTLLHPAHSATVAS